MQGRLSVLLQVSIHCVGCRVVADMICCVSGYGRLGEGRAAGLHQWGREADILPPGGVEFGCVRGSCRFAYESGCVGRLYIVRVSNKIAEIFSNYLCDNTKMDR